jgi:mono/diheme cytochrome c family protein
MNCIKAFLGLAIAAFLAGLVIMFSGAIDVGATNPHSFLTQFVLSTTMDNSVRRHAKDIKPPPLDNPDKIMDGFRHYREMCVGCHLAPGIDSSEIRKGLMPEPPKLQEAVEEWRPNELFWVIKHGVKMTGMPAWGPTHSDDKIWAMVAFLEKLPHMSADQYREMGKMAGPDQEHHHDDADEEHDHGGAMGDHQH